MEFRSENIKKFRIEKNLTQEDLVKCLKERGYELTARTLSNWENGESSPTVDALVVLSAVLEKPIEYFFASVTYQTGVGSE